MAHENLLDRLLPAARRVEVDSIDLATSPERAWQRVRHGELLSSALVRALFAVRTLPERLRGQRPSPLRMRFDDMQSSREQPGFRVLAEDAPRQVAVGAIGKVWRLEIPFVHVEDAQAYADFHQDGYVKVAWAIRVLPLGTRDCRVEVEVRVDATDDESWSKFEQYFRLIGPGSHFIRKTLLSGLVGEFGSPNRLERERDLPGDELLGDASTQATHGITIAAPPERIWPWLVQLGCRRAGFYSWDLLDNGNQRSLTEIDPELLELRVGQVVPATPDGDDGFEVLRIEAPELLVLGGLYDAGQRRQLPFTAARPQHYWHVSWAFWLERLDETATRLHVRARVAHSPEGGLHAVWIGLVHHFMQTAMLRHLAARVEGRLPRDDLRDVLSGISGAAIVLLGLFTPFLRGPRNHWGIDQALAERVYPGDELIDEPRWSWTHGVEIDAPADEVWPWVAQVGADRAGFYSYQWLENLVGCELRNADVVHPEWEVRSGDGLLMHPDLPPLPIARLERGRYFVAHGPRDEQAHAAGKPWVEATWLFFIEPQGEQQSRFISRFRASCSTDLLTRLSFGPVLLEPVGFAMDRRMLLGVKQRVERPRA